MKATSLIASGLCCVCFTVSSAWADMSTTQLRCEYLTEPLAIDTAAPRLSWEIQSSERGIEQTAYQILVASSREALAENKGDLWDSGKIASDQTNQVAYSGKSLAPGQTVFWKVRSWLNNGSQTEWSQPASWRMGLLGSGALKAKWIGDPTPPPLGTLPERLSPMLRKTFKLDKPIKRAVATVSALGVYELRLNGHRVGDAILAPEWTNYFKRVQYQVYDVTSLLKSGDNVAGATLGDGWYAGRLGIAQVMGDKMVRANYGKWLRLMMQIDIEYGDGATDSIVTDGSWKANSDGPIRKACLLDGEVFDARRIRDGWDRDARFNDSAWKPVNVLGRIDAKLVAQPNEPIRISRDLKAKAITEPKPGVYVVDFGQELAGWCKISLRGEAGTTITLRHAEVLQPDGMIYIENLRISKNFGARQEDRFILRGSGEIETYEPHFTYHGFRYVEVTGLSAKPSLDFIIARHFHSDPPVAGEFACSSELLNKLMSNIVWTHRDNMHSVPTDCPQRDERMGWMGDMLVFAQPAIFNMDMAAFFTKWIHDIRNDQADDGRYPDIAPHPYDPNKRLSGVPAWGDCGVVVPWRQYVNYGDVRMLEEHFESARRWVDWIHQHNPDLLWKDNRNNDYADWLNGDTLNLQGFPRAEAKLPKGIFASAFFQHSTELVAKMAAVIGKKEEAAKYGKLAEDIRQAFVKAYIGNNASVEGETQSGYAIALALDLMPADRRAAAGKRMVERVRSYNNHISTGFHTTVMLMNELTRTGHSDVAYMLINNRTIPSWGYTIDHGGTTIWERWDGYVEGRGYQDPNMNSFCHYAIGSVGEWMYRTILGINPDPEKPGYKHIILRPVPGGGLTWAKGKYDSIRGPIASEWKVDGADLNLKISVPANTRATLFLPSMDANNVTEGGKPASEAAGVRFVKMEGSTAVYQLGSGSYEFLSKQFGSKK